MRTRATPPSSLFEHAARVEGLDERSRSPRRTHAHTIRAHAQGERETRFKDSHADQGVPHPDADERGGVPHRTALHDPGENLFFFACFALFNTEILHFYSQVQMQKRGKKEEIETNECGISFAARAAAGREFKVSSCRTRVEQDHRRARSEVTGTRVRGRDDQMALHMCVRHV